jgi:thiol-disulfide isomerase/thioredoxin
MKYILLFFMLIVSFCIQSQEHKLTIKFTGKAYKDLSLRCYMEDDRQEIISGCVNNNDYTFIIDDSIYKKRQDIKIKNHVEETDSTHYLIGFEYINKKGDTCFLYADFKIDNLQTVDAAYVKTLNFPGRYIRNKHGNIVFGSVLVDVFRIPYEQGEQMIKIPKIAQYFSVFPDREKSYNEYISEYEITASLYPDANELMRMLYLFLSGYKSKEDVLKIYTCFSEENRESYYGKKINKFLYPNFTNYILSCGQKDMSEYIVQDSTKYNMIIFSASWCQPCIKEIPLLKKIYEDLGDKLIMTYISIDQGEQRELKWLQILDQYEIPWRNLFARTDEKIINEMYVIQSIPHILLVYPDKYIEHIDVRDNEILAKLYKLFD